MTGAAYCNVRLRTMLRLPESERKNTFVSVG